MNKFYDVVIVVSLIVICFNVCYWGYNYISKNDEMTIEEESIPEGIQIENEVKSIGIAENKEVVNSNNDIAINSFDAMIVNIENNINADGEKTIKVMLVNGNTFDAVFTDKAFDVNSLSISDEIIFEGEIKDNKIYINKIIDVIGF